MKRESDVTSEILASGAATLAQIGKLFRTDAKTLPQRLRGIAPLGQRNGYKVYDIRSAASRLVEPGYEIEEFIRQMSPQELPPLLLKEYWNGQRARLSYEREIGNYWPTEDVVELFAVLEQGVRQSLLLVLDDVDREETLTTGQRKAIRRITDSAISTLKEKLTEAFKDYYENRVEAPSPGRTKPVGDPSGDAGRVFDPEEDEEVDI